MAADLLDIAPAEDRFETVAVAGKELAVRAIKATELARIMRRFPDLRRTFFNKDAPDDARALASLEAFAALVAAGCGHVGEAAYEEAAERLGQAELTRVATFILGLTNPRPEPKDADRPLPPAPAGAGNPLAPPGETSTSSPQP